MSNASNNTTPIVAVGASAGGVKALERFFSAVGEDCALGFVVILHLAADRASSLVEILSRFTRLPVREATDGTTVTAGTVHVIPAGVTLSVEEGRLRLSEGSGHGTVVDAFFSSLADDQGTNAACVVLSGSGSDGTRGLRAIKEHGGLTLAQAAAEHPGMMRSAVATGLVDLVLQPEEMPARLVDYFDRLRHEQAQDSSENTLREAETQLPAICDFLRERTGHDFSAYKKSTILRRIQRRMHVLQTKEGAAFVARLREVPSEIDLLFQDILIGVTQFFRDPAAFDILNTEVLAKLVAERGPRETIRIWVAGCSSGEEAYSIAMMICERMPEDGTGPRIQMFASDIDRAALEVARVGRYPASIAEQVTPARLRKFFVREENTYRVVASLRDMIVFSAHDLLRDPPFSKMDLITCRNLLIYLNAAMQERVIPVFAYALRDRGFLLLGASENVTRHANLFAPVDKQKRLFQRRSDTRPRLQGVPLTPEGMRRFGGLEAPHAPASDNLQSLAEREILSRFAPAGVLVNASGDVLHFSGRTGKYLEMPAGVPDSNIVAMARPGLRMELRTGLRRAAETHRSSVHPEVVIGINGGRQVIDLVVEPIRRDGQEEPLFLVVFRDRGAIEAVKDDDASQPDEIGSDQVRQLETDLRKMRERLQTTTQELETSNEELKSANEELSSINEELQSSNEELETSKEELSSINEELQTVNGELNDRVEELGRANSDMLNLLESTQIATVFLDRDLRIKKFTPAAKQLFYLVESDEGRPISHLRARFTGSDINADADHVLRQLDSVERTVDSLDGGQRFVMRIMPYRTVDQTIAGLVITFVDITRITLAETRIAELTQDLRNRIDSLETLLEFLPIGVFIAFASDGWKVAVNPWGAKLLGHEVEGPTLTGLNTTFDLEGASKIPPEFAPLARAAREGVATSAHEITLKSTGVSSTDLMLSATPFYDADGNVRGAVAAAVDISDRKRTEAHQQMLLHELQHRVKNILATISALASRMLRTTRSVDEFSQAFLMRLQAMGRAHALLAEENWTGAETREILAASLSPFVTTTSAVKIDVPPIKFRPNAAATLAMIFHELASNAAKYGALAAGGGSIEVTGRVVGESGKAILHLQWRERPAQAVQTTMEKGFGTHFIASAVRHEFGGEVDLHVIPEGLTCDIRFALSQQISEVPGH